MNRLLAVGLAWVLVGCAHRSQFTSAEELRELTRTQKPERAFTEVAIDVPRYELAGPFAEDAQPHETATPWGALLTGSAKGQFEADGALGCAARELARFSLQHSGTASDSLQAFVLGRCGSAGSRASAHTLTGTAPQTVSDEQLWTQWRPDVEQMFRKIEPGELAGVALARSGEKAWLLLLRQRPLARLAPSARTFDALGQVIIEGTLKAPGNKLEALINQGELGFAECEADVHARLPAFRFTCIGKKGDAQAWLTIGAWEEGRVLGKEVARILVWPSGQPGNVYVAPAYAQAGPPTAEAFVDRVNAVRGTAGMQPLSLVVPQSQTAASVAPYFFGGRDGPMKDKIALGLMAGWDVGGLVASGSFTADWVPQADSGALLSGMLEDPGGRRSLLNPKASHIAAGLVTEASTLGALISTYELFGAVDPVEAPRKLIAALTAARAKLGKGPAEWIANPSDFYVRVSKALLSNELSPDQAAQAFMRETVNFTNRPVSGLTQTLSNLDDLKWADSVMQHPAPQVLIFVGLQKAPGEAWAQYVVLVLLLEGAPGGPQA